MHRLTRREFLLRAAALSAAPAPLVNGVKRFPAQRPRRAVPTASQLTWQRDELAIFVHFGVNTFTGREWGDGSEDPRIFSPSNLDPRQWARAARAAGFRAMVLTAKHHDGFCLWPTRTTDHSVRSSPWQGGDGDGVRLFVDACRAEGLRAGLYCSPWDRHEPSYGDSARYNDLYCDQLTELLTRYGDIHEVWFDGANGEGPNGRRQEYDWPRVWDLVRRLQPEAVMFSDAGPDIRWIGNEQGTAGDPNWSTVDPATVPFPGMHSPEIVRQLQHGDVDGTVWRPGECDVSIRPGWFYHPEEDERVRSTADLTDLYFASVGRNSKLLLNVPPMPSGLFHARDVDRIAGLRTNLDALFAHHVGRGELEARSPAAGTSIEVELERASPVAIADLREDITLGQAVAHYRIEGYDGSAWTTLGRGTTIGHRKLDRFDPIPLSRVRLTVEEAVAWPFRLSLDLFAADGTRGRARRTRH